MAINLLVRVCALLLLLVRTVGQVNLLKVTSEVFDVNIYKEVVALDVQHARTLGTTPALRRRFLVFRIFFDQVGAHSLCSLVRCCCWCKYESWPLYESIWSLRAVQNISPRIFTFGHRNIPYHYVIKVNITSENYMCSPCFWRIAKVRRQTAVINQVNSGSRLLCAFTTSWTSKQQRMSQVMKIP